MACPLHREIGRAPAHTATTPGCCPFKQCADLVACAGGTVIGTMQIIDRCEACVSLDVPNVSLVEYQAPPNYPAASCPMCAAGVPVTAF